MRSFFRNILVALCLVFASLQIFAHEWVTERSWVEDPKGDMTLAQAQQAPQTPLSETIFTQGFSKSAYWIRLRIDPQGQPANDKLIIRLRPPYQDQIWLYDPLAASDRVRATGDYFNWHDDEYHSLNLNFVIPVGVQPRDIWLKLKTQQSTLTSIEVMTEEEVRAADRQEELAAMLYLSILCVCLGWAVLTRINRKDALLSRYIVREVMALLYALMALGYLRALSASWLPTSWLDPLSNLIVFSFMAIVIWFDSRLLAEFKPNPWLARGFLSLAYFFPIEIVLTLTGYASVALRLSSVIIMVGIILVVFCAVSTRAWKTENSASEDERPVYKKTFLVSIYGLIALIILLNRLPIMGVIAGHENYFYYNLIYPLLSSTTLLLLVQVRLNRQAKQQQQAQHRFELAEQEAKQERAQRIEQTNFLRMLTHELKTPLSVLQLITDSVLKDHKYGPRASEAVTNMDAIINRCLAVDRASVTQPQLIYTDVDANDLIHVCAQIAGIQDRVMIHTQETPIICTDSEHLKTILINLMDNARKYAAENSVIEITSNTIIEEGGKPCWDFVIANNTSRHGQPNPERVFEKYYRHEAATRESGSGLGLFLVKILVEQLGGAVTYESGSQRVAFRLSLPLRPDRHPSLL